jgi:hypothetical protein
LAFAGDSTMTSCLLMMGTQFPAFSGRFVFLLGGLPTGLFRLNRDDEAHIWLACCIGRTEAVKEK